MIQEIKNEEEQNWLDFLADCRKKINYWQKRALKEKCGSKLVDDLEGSKKNPNYLAAQKYLGENNVQFVDVMVNEFHFKEEGYYDIEQSKIPIAHQKLFINGEQVSEIKLYHPDQEQPDQESIKANKQP